MKQFNLITNKNLINKKVMKNLKKDLLLLFLYSISNTIVFIWAVIYPYLGSYMKHENPEITLKQVFSTTLGLFLGITVGNLFLSKFYFLFGIKKTIQIGGIFNLLNCIFYFSFPSSVLIIFCNTIFTGAIYQLGVLSVTYYLSEKYENGYIYCTYAFIGNNVANVLWPYLALKLINPDNIGMTARSFINGEAENYFPWEISQNFPLLMTAIGLVNFFITIIPSIFLKDPPHITIHFLLWINAVILRNKRALEELDNEYKKTENQILNKTINNLSKSMNSSIWINYL